jgi:hypothetical protein
MSYSGFKRKDWASGRSGKGPSAIRGYKAGGQTTTVHHREFITNIQSGPTADGSFNRCFPSGQPINPGNAALFPWLSRCAQAFTQYKINYMKFHYVSTSGEFTGGTSGNAALGSFNMCVQYNSNAIAYTSKAQMLNEEGAVSVVPSRDGVLHTKVQPQSVLKKQYVRGTGISAPYDPLMYDLGVFYAATDGTPTANIVLGEIWVEYEITFYKASQINTTLEGVVYQASGILIHGADPHLQTNIQGKIEGGANPSSGAYFKAAPGTARVWSRLPQQAASSPPTLPSTATTGAQPTLSSVTGGCGGVSQDGTAIVIPGGCVERGGLVSIAMQWTPDPNTKTGTRFDALVGTNTDLTVNPYVAGAWGDVIWDITNGQCLNCSSTNMTPTANLVLNTQGTIMLLQPKDVTQDVIVKFAVRGPGGESRVVAPVNPNPPSGVTLMPTQWEVIANAIDSFVSARILEAVNNPEVMYKYWRYLTNAAVGREMIPEWPFESPPAEF